LFSSISNVPNIKSILLSSEDSSGNNLLVNAVDRSNIELIHYLIDELGFDGNCKVIGSTKEVQNISTNLLHLAVIRNNHECINAIVKVIDKNTLNSLYQGLSPLMFCLFSDGCEQILLQLLQHSDVDLDNLVDFSFPLAIMNGNMGVLKLFLSNQIIVEKLKAKPEQHYRFLILATATGNSDVLKDLLDLTTVDICDTLKRDIAMEILKYTSDIYMEELSYYNIIVDDSSSAVTPDDTWSLLHICAHEGLEQFGQFWAAIGVHLGRL
jgi:ankyrin repeat protein